ncbi:MAG: TonB family protein [Gemmatimonadaceae bacterium]
MRITLSETGQARKRSPLGTAVSVVLHAALFIMVAAGAGISKEGTHEKPRPDILVYTPTPPDPHPVLHTAGSSHSQWNPAGPPVTTSEVDIPVTDIPTMDDHIGVESRPVPQGDFGRTSVAGAESPTNARNSIADVFDVNSVEIPVKPFGNHDTRYPAILAAAGIEGHVVVRYVVDTLGHVETGSIATVSSTHALFERSVREALPRFRFSSAEVGGRKVRQLVEQSFGFELRH